MTVESESRGVRRVATTTESSHWPTFGKYSGPATDSSIPPTEPKSSLTDCRAPHGSTNDARPPHVVGFAG